MGYFNFSVLVRIFFMRARISDYSYFFMTESMERVMEGVFYWTMVSLMVT